VVEAGWIEERFVEICMACYLVYRRVVYILTFFFLPSLDTSGGCDMPVSLVMDWMLVGSGCLYLGCLLVYVSASRDGSLIEITIGTDS